MVSGGAPGPRPAWLMSWPPRAGPLSMRREQRVRVRALPRSSVKLVCVSTLSDYRFSAAGSPLVQ